VYFEQTHHLCWHRKTAEFNTISPFSASESLLSVSPNSTNSAMKRIFTLKEQKHSILKTSMWINTEFQILHTGKLPSSQNGKTTLFFSRSWPKSNNYFSISTPV